MNKTTSKRMFLRIFSGAKLFLFILFLGSSVFASSGEESSLEKKVSEKKDISVFVSRLSDRLQGVAQEIFSLSADKQYFAGASGSQAELPQGLFDVQNHLYKSEILGLADMGVVDSSREKFYPNNYLRRYELVILSVKYRLAQSDKQFSPIVFPLRGWFSDVAQNTTYAPYVAYAEQQGWIDQFISKKDDKKMFLPNRFLTKKSVCAFLNLDLTHDFCSEDLIKRGEFAALLFRGLESKNTIQENKQDTQIVQSEPKSQGQFVSQMKALFTFSKSQ